MKTGTSRADQGSAWRSTLSLEPAGMAQLILAAAAGIALLTGAAPSGVAALILGVISALTLWQWMVGRRSRHEARACLEQIAASADTGVVVFDRRWRIVEINATAAQAYGYPPGDLLGRHVSVLEGFPAGGSPSGAQGMKATQFRKDGTPFAAEITLLPFQPGARRSRVAIVRDFSSRSEADAWSGAMRAAVDAARVSVLVTDTDGTIRWANDHFWSESGYAASDVVGRNARMLQSDGHAPEVFEEMCRDLVAATGWHGTLVNRRKDGSDYVAETSVAPVTGADGAITHYVAVQANVTRQRQLEGDLRANLTRLSDLQRLARLGSWEMDLRSGALTWSPEMYGLFGMDPETASPSQEFVLARVHPGDRARVRRIYAESLKGGQPYASSHRLLMEDGSVRHLREVGYTELGANDEVVRIRGSIQEVTDRVLMEEQLLRVQRMESIGLLGAGLAHDLNNILAPIILAAPLLRGNLPEERRHSLVDRVERGALRGSELVQQIVGFAGGASGERQVIQAKHLLRDTAKMARETFPRDISVEERIPSDLWTTRATASQLHQVLLNLAVNARDAMPAGGTLVLAAENVTLGWAEAAKVPGASPGRWLVLRVEDTGVGIPREVLGRIWDPFFTSKEQGKGTGLGLSTVRAIVIAHEGFVAVASEEGRGTRFEVYLPAHGGEDGAAAMEPRTLNLEGRGKWVLLVDDEESIRFVGAALLEGHGFSVVAARDGTEAIELLETRGNDFDLVLTDLDMPGTNGRAVAETAAGLQRPLPVLTITGRHEMGDALVSDGLAVECIPKPFSQASLLEAVGRWAGLDA